MPVTKWDGLIADFTHDTHKPITTTSRSKVLHLTLHLQGPHFNTHHTAFNPHFRSTRHTLSLKIYTCYYFTSQHADTHIGRKMEWNHGDTFAVNALESTRRTGADADWGFARL